MLEIIGMTSSQGQKIFLRGHDVAAVLIPTASEARIVSRCVIFSAPQEEAEFLVREVCRRASEWRKVRFLTGDRLALNHTMVDAIRFCDDEITVVFNNTVHGSVETVLQFAATQEDYTRLVRRMRGMLNLKMSRGGNAGVFARDLVAVLWDDDRSQAKIVTRTATVQAETDSATLAERVLRRHNHTATIGPNVFDVTYLAFACAGENECRAVIGPLGRGCEHSLEFTTSISGNPLAFIASLWGFAKADPQN